MRPCVRKRVYKVAPPSPEGDASKFENNYFAETCSVSEEGSYSRLMDLCIPHLQA